GLTLIGVVLAIATPQINKLKEKRIVEQSVDSLSVFDEQIREVLKDGQENRRIIREFSLKKGEFFINGDLDTIELILRDFSKPYSEPGIVISLGNVLVETESDRKKYNIYLILNYSGIINLTYANKDLAKKFTPTNLPYSFNIDNEGLVENLIEISVSETSGLGGVIWSATGQENPTVCPNSCEDDNVCTSDSCNSGTCSYINNTLNCPGGSCSNGQCVPIPPNPCGQGHSYDSGTNTCTATITDIIEDGYIWTNGTNYIRYNNLNEIIIRGFTNPVHKGYIAWNIETIPDDITIENVLFRYNGKAATDQREFIGSVSESPLYSSDSILLNAISNSVYRAADGSFVELGAQNLTLLPLANTKMNESLALDWFAIGMTTGFEDGGASIYASEAGGDRVPALIVKYSPRAEPVCGNGNSETGEQCDDGNTITESCVYGLTSCTVCDSNCNNVPGATSYCGNGNIETGEACDGANLNSRTCESLNPADYAGGVLGCTNSCAFNFTQCTKFILGSEVICESGCDVLLTPQGPID
ncbi:MAG: hypothetical protein EPN88_07905, partial [Bacteroidetes bacterium]